MQPGKLKLEQKFILMIIILGTISSGLLGFAFYSQVKDTVVGQKKEDSMKIAATAAEELDGDLFRRIASPEDAGYETIYRTLENFRIDPLITYIYALREEGDHLVFVVDTDEAEPADFLEAYECTEGMRRALQGEVSCDREVTSDKWGSYYSAYAPIRAADGTVVGIVGCDVMATSIRESLNGYARKIILLVTVFAAVSIMIYVHISRILMGRDILTEIPNYEHMIRHGKKLAKKKSLASYTGILINIKDFKYINQRAGAKVSELVLREYANLLLRNREKGSFVASTGGDNFFVLVKKGDEDDFLGKIMKTEVTVWAKEEPVVVPVSVRCGLYLVRNDDDIDMVLNACTFALSRAKAKSAGTDYQWFEDAMFEQMMMEKELLNAFRTGIVKHEFVVYYQPKVNIETNTLCGAEALVRWYRNGKIVPPGQFIPVLEKNNLITELDFYVLDQVCRDIERWQKQGIEVVRISTNFSKLHLSNPDFAGDLLAVLGKYGIETKYLEAELTESSGYYDLVALTNFVRKMNDAELSVSIDDFGTGYSSLSLLKDLNVNVVKVDKSFFKDIEAGDAVNEKMVENVIRMVQDLGREVICEGIETKKQADFLRKVPSPIVQGYLYDKPLPHGDFEKKLKNPHYED